MDINLNELLITYTTAFTADVIVKEALKDQRVKEGSSEINLKCVVDNPKNHKVSWTLNGKPIDIKNIDKFVNFNVTDISCKKSLVPLYFVFLRRFEMKSENGGIHKLKVKNIQLSDEAIIACVIGERETSAKILVDEGEICIISIEFVIYL